MPEHKIRKIPSSVEEWKDYIEQVIKSEDNVKRKFKSLYVDTVYKAQHKELVVEEVVRQFGQEASKRPVVIFPYMRQVTDTIAGSLYNQEVKRDLQRTKKTIKEYIKDKVFPDLTDNGDTSSKKLFVQGTILTHTLFSVTEDKMKTLIYPQYNFDLVYEWKNEVDRVLRAVVVSRFNGVGSRNEYEEYYIYMENSFILLKYEKGKIEVVSQIQHNKGYLPFLVIHKHNPGLDIYLEPEIALAEQDVMMCAAWSNLYTTQANQTNALPVMSVPINQAGDLDNDGKEPNKLPINDSSNVLILYNKEGSPISDFKYVTPQVDFQGSLSVVRESEKTFAVSQGLPANFFSERLEVTATEIITEDARLKSYMRRMKDKFQQWERSVLDISLRTLAADDPEAITNIPPNMLLVTEWLPEGKLERADIEDIQKVKDMEVIDKADIVQLLNPRLSREEAIQYLEERFGKEEDRQEQNNEEQPIIQEDEDSEEEQEETLVEE